MGVAFPSILQFTDVGDANFKGSELSMYIKSTLVLQGIVDFCWTILPYTPKENRLVSPWPCF